MAIVAFNLASVFLRPGWLDLVKSYADAVNAVTHVNNSNIAL